MAAKVDSSQLSENLEKLSLNTDKSTEPEDDETGNGPSKFGLPLTDVYKLAVAFYKEKEGKAVHFSYEDKLQLVAFTQQVLHGPYASAVRKLPPLGALDVVGKDRRLAWQKLGTLTGAQARAGFVELLSRKCPLFSTFIEAHRREKKENERLHAENEKLKLMHEEEERKKLEEQNQLKERLEREEAVKRQIQQALNEQTYDQFRKYAEQHYPGDPEKQGTLVRQLQEQHYVQYTQQLQAVQQQQQQAESRQKSEPTTDTVATNTLERKPEAEIEEDGDETVAGELLPASMWTRSGLEDFKKEVAQAEGDGVVRIGHGETVTVRVPTNQAGTRLFWEFATDHYDIGFGVYFEYGTPTTNLVSVHISESEDEDRDDVDEESDEDAIDTGELEAASYSVNGLPRSALLTEIVPVYRRDCQDEVYAGSHQYPGEGVYLLKFDNSYSLWRSKTLYYRVYYTQ